MFDSASSNAVYPRWRGEHCDPAGPGTITTGLSPLARGTLLAQLLLLTLLRFIPAGAGNTAQPQPNAFKISVYPRWRGEHAGKSNEASAVIGLSPLARGTLDFPCYVLATARFIPAGAGNTLRIMVGRAGPTVYPRWRGEHARDQPEHLREYGLSPLARGTQNHSGQGFQPERFIPAGAGNTRSGAGHSRRLPVYPRWRGEHISMCHLRKSKAGLSPLARGTRRFETAQ